MNYATQILCFLILFGVSCHNIAYCQSVEEIFVDFKGEPQRVTYSTYIPPLDKDRPVPVLVCLGGLPVRGDGYGQSDMDACMDGPWREFADEQQMIILGLGFLFIEKDWPHRESYQFPQTWSGEALIKVLQILAEEFPIDDHSLYFFGLSAGAQFSVRFAQMRPDMVKAVAAHAAGGYDLPDAYIPTKFLITVGEHDNEIISRLEFAKIFFQASKDAGIDIRLEVIPGIGHRPTEKQIEMSREFFRSQLP